MKLVYAENGVAFLKSEIIHSPHGFSTRVGGVSAIPHTAFLNLAFGRGDDREKVLRNLELFSEAVGICAKDVCSVPQIHSNEVMCVDERHRGLGYYRDTELECDGYVTSQRCVALGVKTADCIPILLECRDSCGTVISVGALHAGWRGTAKNIVRQGIKKMKSLSEGQIFAAIGSGICQSCFQVRADCVDVMKASLGASFDKYIRDDEDGEHFYPDLQAINRELLVSCGVAPENIDVSSHCTCCEGELFYSHRRMNGVRGTMLAVISKGKNEKYPMSFSR